MIVFLFLSFHFLEELNNAVSRIVSGRIKKLLTIFVMIIFVSAFALKPCLNLLKSIKYIVTYEQVNPYQEIAEQISAIQFSSPYAIIRSSQKPPTDLYIAYYLKKQLLGRPLSNDVDGITEELRKAGAKSLVVFDNPEIVEKLNSDKRYFHIASQKLEGNKRYQHTVNINVKDFEIITGWDEEVNIYELNNRG